MGNKELIVLGIALQTRVLRICPVHDQIYLGDDDYVDRAFALAVELVRRHKPYVQDFDNDVHALTALLSCTIGGAPDSCPDCAGSPENAAQAQEPGRHSWKRSLYRRGRSAEYAVAALI